MGCRQFPPTHALSLTSSPPSLFWDFIPSPASISGACCSQREQRGRCFTPSENKHCAPPRKAEEKLGKKTSPKSPFVPAARTSSVQPFSVRTCIQPHQDGLWVLSPVFRLTTPWPAPPGTGTLKTMTPVAASTRKGSRLCSIHSTAAGHLGNAVFPRFLYLPVV